MNHTSRSATTGQFNSINRWNDGRLLCTKCESHFCVERFNVDKRSTKTGYSSWCKSCLAAWRLANAATLKEKKKLDYVANRERRTSVNAAAQRRNKDASNKRSARWRELNPEQRKVSANAWVKRNPAYSAARTAQRLAVKIKATPAWADRAAIQVVYEKAAEFGMWVDHIVPLVSELVCGLHCEANLQLLTPAENIRKGNRFWPDMP